MNIGNTIRRIRKNRGMTQAQLAEAAGMAVNSIRLYESGKRVPSIDVRIALAQKLDCDLQELLTEEESDAFVSQPINQLAEALKEQYLEFSQFAQDEHGQSIIASYYQLNDAGQSEAVKRVGELARLREYQRTEKQEPPSDGNNESSIESPDEASDR